jgi:acyl-CoA thioesterase-1
MTGRLFQTIRILVIALFFAAPWPAQAADAPIRILALGDSLMQGYGLPPGKDVPAQLEAALKAKGYNVAITNAGVSGDTSSGGRAVLEWTLGAPSKEWPDGVIVEFGGNDALRALPPSDTEKNLEAMLKQLNAQKMPVLFTGMMAPRNLGADYTTSFDAIFPKLAKKYGVLFYPFFLEGVALNKDLLQADGIHPNTKGVDVIVKGILPFAEKLAKQAGEKHAR